MRMTEVENLTHNNSIINDFPSFPPLTHISMKYLFSRSQVPVNTPTTSSVWRRFSSLGWRHSLRQEIRIEFTMKELLILTKNSLYSGVYQQAIFLDRTLFEIHDYWKKKYNDQKLAFAISGWRCNLPCDIVHYILTYLPKVGKSPSGPWKKE
jgi:hypothetical protein